MHVAPSGLISEATDEMRFSFLIGERVGLLAHIEHAGRGSHSLLELLGAFGFFLFYFVAVQVRPYSGRSRCPGYQGEARAALGLGLGLGLGLAGSGFEAESLRISVSSSWQNQQNQPHGI